MKFSTIRVLLSGVFILPLMAEAALVPFISTSSGLDPALPYPEINNADQSPFSISASSSIGMSIDDVAISMAINSLTIDFDSTSKIYGYSQTVGLGQKVDFLIELTVRDFTLVANNVLDSVLTPATDGFYTASAVGGIVPLSGDDIIFDYVITGPTEQLSGTSDPLSLNEVYVDFNGPQTSLDTNDYPNSLILGEFYYRIEYQDFTVFEETVDGVPLSLVLASGDSHFEHMQEDVAFALVPEPAHYAAALGLLSLALILFGKHIRPRKQVC